MWLEIFFFYYYITFKDIPSIFFFSWVHDPLIIFSIEKHNQKIQSKFIYNQSVLSWLTIFQFHFGMYIALLKIVTESYTQIISWKLQIMI